MNLRKLFKKECRHGFDLNDVIDLTKSKLIHPDVLKHSITIIRKSI